MIIVFLADGFEETELVAPVDILRRSGATVQLVGIGGKEITGAHGIKITADVTDEEFVMSKRAEMVFLPGGMPGTTNLDNSQVVHNTLTEAKKRGIFVAAICAAPIILYKNGQLEGQKATIFPKDKEKLPPEIYSDSPICDSGRVLTAQSCGVSIEFGLLMVEKLAGLDRANTIRNSIYMLK